VSSFAPTIVTAVLAHMNDDHANDSLLIVRAFAHRDAVRARMVDVDGEAGHWVYALPADEPDDTEKHTLRVPWTAPISERAEIRREIVVLYDRACAELGITPRPHD